MLLAFGNAIDNADGNVMTVLGPYIMRALSMDLVLLGWIHAIGRLSRMIFGPLWAMAGDRFDRRTLMVIVTGVWGIWTLLAGTADTAFQFFLFYSIAVVGTVATEPLTASITADLFGEKDRGQAYGVLRSVGYVVLIVLVPVALVFTRYDEGWRWILFTLGGLSMLSGLLTLLFLKDPGRGVMEEQMAPDERLHKADFKFFVATPSLWVLGFSLLLLTGAVGTQFFTVFLGSLRVPQSQADYILGIYLVANVVSVLLGGRLGDWAHRLWPQGGRIALMQVYLLVYAGMAALCLVIDWPLWAYYPLFLAFGLVAGVGTPACVLPLISTVVLPETRSTAFGVMLSFVQGAGMAVFSVVLPAVANTWGWNPAFFWILVVPYVVNAVLWGVLYKTVPRDHSRTLAELKRRNDLASSEVHPKEVEPGFR